jgi:hypothetical protein
MIDRVISCGQTGADRIAWRVAQSFGVPTGGAMLWGFRAEDGRHVDFAETYGAHQLPTTTQAAHLLANVRDSDGTIWFGRTDSLTGRTALETCERLDRPCLVISLNGERDDDPQDVVRWIVRHQIRILNVAGNRESLEPSITERTEAFLRDVLARANGLGNAAECGSDAPEHSSERLTRPEGMSRQG